MSKFSTSAWRGRIAVGAVAVLAAGVLGVAGPGVAAAEAAAPGGCPGRLAKSVKFATGELRVYKNRQYACAVTVATKPGPRRTMTVTLQPRGGRAVVDSGRFTRQAGPVSVHALNRCVRATGAVAGRAGSTGWILC
ncbi:hypothetical protein [Streptomyces rubrolavendulae]|uniref:Secreted protein n=1 Tax=Streptomyces rubrolavendulae TaxID=285473 RepID=A0A1D8G0I8_9ACTN|nr:hypothetical protein [Streptomyces rubrolavendulae]AOT58977.1 hypothetical protein A4G23_01802 [Streptomyces rubrolavendulae]